jgi:hypothetical protein
MTDKHSRRGVLGALASVPALAVPAVAIAEPVDPIFAAIEKHRAACSALVAVMGDCENWVFVGMPEDKAEKDTRSAMLETVPTTLAGMGAMLKYIADVRELFGPDEELKEFATSLAQSPIFA